MDKVILVIDDPVRCLDCPLEKHIHMGGRVCGIDNKAIDVGLKVKPDWCPLQPAPEEQMIWYDDGRSDWERGYNNCLREIVGRE